ncbi:MAG: hypothetical protein JJ992_24820, partial [Planctomycetes bacterium]|nr:hypothetical protein [Planctomycetota bacterium]
TYDGLVGLSVQAISPDGHVQYRTIVANDAHTVTIDRPWDQIPVFNDPLIDPVPRNNYYYRISALPEDQTDGTLRGPRVVWSINAALGGPDTISGGGGNDIVIGGAAGDELGAGSGDDLVLGDAGRLDLLPDPDALPGESEMTLFDLVRTESLDVGGADTISAGAGRDLVLAGYGGDTVFGDDATGSSGAGDLGDILIGDNGTIEFVSGAVKRIFTADITEATGGADTIAGNAGNDVILGGVNGSSDLLSGGDGDDILLGDDGELVYDDPLDPSLATLDVVRTGDVNLGGPDTINGDSGRDLILGGRGGDTIDGGSHDDMILGDFAEVLLLANQLHVVRTIDVTEGGADQIQGGTEDDVLVGGAFADAIDGDAGNDLIFGDGVQLSWRTDDITNPRFQSLIGTQIYSTSASNLAGVDQVDGTARDYRNPDGSSPPGWASWQIQELFHTTAIQTANDNSFGDDYLAGGAGDDMIFGQLGNDTIQGDGSIEFASAGNFAALNTRVGAARDASNTLLLNPSFEAATDGDDYVEGNGGNDVIFGGLGQDDLIGGSSDLFALDVYNSSVNERPDGSDLIFGGAGTHVDRNDDGLLMGVNGNQL